MKLCGSERAVLALCVGALGLMLAIAGLRELSAEPLTAIADAASPAASESEIPETDRVDINRAGLEELMSLPEIGRVRAEAILAWREENGPFRYPEDLIRVDGIGPGITEALLGYVTTGGD